MRKELFLDVDGCSGVLTTPEVARRAPAAIFAHGGGQTYRAFEAEAAQLSRGGVVTLLLDLPAARQLPDLTQPHLIVESLAASRAIVDAAVTLLRDVPATDRRRIAYVGVSYGAWVGVMYAAVSAFIPAYVLIATPPRMSEVLVGHPSFAFLREDVSCEQLVRSKRVLRPADAVENAVALRERDVLLQWAVHDEIISADAASELEAASGTRAVSERYGTGHQAIATDPDARADRTQWLMSRWQVPGSPLPA
jgi:pimeloyl-ACP methyl ester carboxylesterase